MQAVTITQITPHELELLIENSINKALSSQRNETKQETDELLTVQEAAKFLSLSVPTVYGLIHKGAIPFMKRSKRCYFYKFELNNYLKQGRRKTNEEINSEVNSYLGANKKG
jgi:excisionase family DNA binding protein